MVCPFPLSPFPPRAKLVLVFWTTERLSCSCTLTWSRRSTAPGVPVRSRQGDGTVELDVETLVQQWARELVGGAVFNSLEPSKQDRVCEYVVCAAFLPSVGAIERIGTGDSSRNQILKCAADDFQEGDDRNSCYVYGVIARGANNDRYWHPQFVGPPGQNLS